MVAIINIDISNCRNQFLYDKTIFNLMIKTKQIEIYSCFNKYLKIKFKQIMEGYQNRSKHVISTNLVNIKSLFMNTEVKISVVIVRFLFC